MATDFFKYANLAAFVGLSLVCVRDWRAGRGTNAKWAAIAFGSLAAIGAISLALQENTVPRGYFLWFIKALLAIVVLFPYFLFRFAAGFGRTSRFGKLAASVSTAVVVAWSFAIPYFPFPGMPEPWWWRSYRVLILAQWAILFASIGARLWFDSGHETTVPRRRMRTLALSSAVMMGATLLSSVAKTPQTPGMILTTQAMFFGSTILFFIGFAPPKWLLHLWRRKQSLEMQAAMGDLFRAESQTDIASLLLPIAVRVIG